MANHYGHCKAQRGHLAEDGGKTGGREADGNGYVLIHSFIHSQNIKGSSSSRALSLIQQITPEHHIFAQPVLEAKDAMVL